MKKVTLVESRAFPGRDPLVRAYFPAEEEVAVFESSVKKNSPNARWNESFCVVVGGGSSLVRFGCYDFRGGSAAFVGNVLLDLAVDGTHSVELLRCTMVFEVATVGEASSIIVRVDDVGGLQLIGHGQEFVCRGVYAGLVVGEASLSNGKSSTFRIEPVGGHSSLELSLWVSGAFAPLATALVDLRVGGPQIVHCQDCLAPASISAEVLNNSNALLSTNNFSATICVTNFAPSLANISRWRLSGCAESSWLQPDDYWCFSTTSRKVKLEVIPLNCDAKGFVVFDLDDTMESTEQLVTSNSVVTGGCEGVITWGWSSQKQWRLGAPRPRLQLADAHEVVRRAKQCMCALTVLSAVTFVSGVLSLTCVSGVSMVITTSQGVTTLRKSMELVLTAPAYHLLFSLAQGSSRQVYFAQISPFHLLDKGRQWILLESAGEVGGFIEIEWSSAFTSSSQSEQCPVNVICELEVVEARGLRSADLGGTCDTYCVVQSLPISEGFRLTSNTVRNSVDPQWNWSCKLELQSSAGIVLNILDADSANDEFLGMLSLPSESFFWRCDTGDSWLPLSDQCSGATSGESCGAVRIKWRHRRGQSRGRILEALDSGDCEISVENVELEEQLVKLWVAGLPSESTSHCRITSLSAQMLIANGSDLHFRAHTSTGEFQGSIQLTSLALKRKRFDVALSSINNGFLVMTCEIQVVFRRKSTQRWSRNTDGTAAIDVTVRQLRLEDPLANTVFLTFPHCSAPVEVHLVEGVEAICSVRISTGLSCSEDSLSLQLLVGTENVAETTIAPLCDFDDRSGFQWFPLSNATTIVGAIELEYQHSLVPMTNLTLTATGRHRVVVEVVQIRGLWPLQAKSSPLPQAQVSVAIGDHSFCTMRAAPSLCPIVREGHAFVLDNLDLGGEIRVSVIDAVSLEPIGIGSVKLREMLQSTTCNRWLPVVDNKTMQTCDVLLSCSCDALCIENKSCGGIGCLHVEGSKNLIGKKNDGTLRDTCNIVARCVVWGPSRRVIVFDKSTVGIPNTLSPSWETTFCSLPDDCSAQLLVYDKADGDFFLGSAVVDPKSIGNVATSFRLVNCDIDGRPNALLARLLLAINGSDDSLGTISILRSEAESTEVLGMVLDISPQSFRCVNSVESPATIQLQFKSASGAPTKVEEFTMPTGTSTFAQTPTRICVLNPSVIAAVAFDSFHKELARGSIVVSHDGVSPMDDEVWTTFLSSSTGREFGKLHSFTKVIASAMNAAAMVERAASIQFHALAGLVVRQSATPSMLFLRVVDENMNLLHETRTFRAPQANQGALRLLMGKTFATKIPSAHDGVSVELWLKHRAGGTTQLGVSFLPPLREESLPSSWIPLAALTNERSTEINTIAAIKISRDVTTHWVTGRTLTFMWIRERTAGPLANLVALAAEIEVLQAGQIITVQRRMTASYSSTKLLDESFGVIMESVSLPSNATAVVSIRIYHELLSGERLLVGKADSKEFPWTTSSVSTRTLALFLGGDVATDHRITITNALGASTDQSRICLGLVVDTVELTSAIDELPSLVAELQMNDKSKLVAIIQMRGTPEGAYFPVSIADATIEQNLSRKSFAEGNIYFVLRARSGVLGTATLVASSLQTIGGVVDLQLKSDTETIGTLRVKFTIKLCAPVRHRSHLKPSSRNSLVVEECSTHRVLQLISVSGALVAPLDAVVHMQEGDSTLCLARFHVEESTHLVNADEALDGHSSTFGRIKPNSRGSSVNLSLWRSLPPGNELIFGGRAVVTRDMIERSVTATIRGAPGRFSVTITDSGQQLGLLTLCAFDTLTFDTQVLRRLCVLVKCISSSGMTAGQQIVLTCKDESGNPREERIDLKVSTMATVGPFTQARDAIIRVHVEDSTNAESTSSLNIDVAQRLSHKGECALPPVIDVQCTLSNGKDQPTVTLGLRLLISCGEEMLNALMDRQRNAPSLHHSPPRQVEKSPTLFNISMPVREHEALELLEVPCSAATRPGELAIGWRDQAIFLGGRSLRSTHQEELHIFEARRQRWVVHPQPVLEPVKGANERSIIRDGAAAVRCGDGLVVDGGFGAGGLDPNLTQFTGRYEGIHSVYQISSKLEPSPLPTDEGYWDQTCVCSLKGTRAARGWRIIRTRGAGKSPRSDHTLVRIGDAIILAFGGFSIRIVERVLHDPMTVASTAALHAIEDVAQLVDDERLTYMQSFLTVGGDNSQLASFNTRRQTGRGIVSDATGESNPQPRRFKQCRMYEGEEHLCSDLRCFNLDTFEWSTLETTFPDLNESGRSHISILGDAAVFPGSMFSRVVQPKPTAGHVAEFIAPERSMVVFGGLQQGDQGLVACADLSYLHVDALQWFECKADSRIWPAARYGHSSTQVAGRDVLIFGGSGTRTALPPDELLWRLRWNPTGTQTSLFERILLPTSAPITSRFRSSICFVPDDDEDGRGTLVVGSGILQATKVGDAPAESSSSLRQRMMVDNVAGIPTRSMVLRVSI